MKMESEDDILDEEFRKNVIAEILGQENVNRKKEARKRYDIFRDKTSKYVRERLQKQGLNHSTIETMMNRAGNISILKKIVSKLAGAYTGGVTRQSNAENETDRVLEGEIIESYVDYLNMDKKQKKADRYRELFRNCMIQIVPIIDHIETDKKGSDVYKIAQRVLAPWQYDVIEDSADRECPRVVILSEYGETSRAVGHYAMLDEAAKHPGGSVELGGPNQRDEIIADSPIDQGEGGQVEFIWWSGKYHFTTDEHGAYIGGVTPENLENPIGELNFIPVSEDQDGSFWAEGGDDLVEGSILVNVIITDMFAIAYQQGWGQFYVIGKGISHNQPIGPHQAMVFEIDDKTEPGQRPEVGVVSANPPLGDWMASIEQYVALLLSTNNLSTGSVSVKLDAKSFASGIAMIIDMAESVNDINDTQSMFLDVERQIWHLIKAWHNKYYEGGFLVEELMNLGPINDGLSVNVKFEDIKPVMTEKEKLENLEKRKNLGLNTMIDLMMKDNPDLSREEAEEKLKQISEEKLKRMETIASNMIGNNQNDDKDEDEENDDQRE